MQPLQRAVGGPLSDTLIEETMRVMNLTRKKAIAVLQREAARTEYWLNDTYQVAKSTVAHGMIQLNIRRRDGGVIMRDWREFQAIKNQLVGEECEGIELYPAESRKVDTSNKYHIWCAPDPAFRFPIGWQERDVIEQDDCVAPGMKQRAVQ